MIEATLHPLEPGWSTIRTGKRFIDFQPTARRSALERLKLADEPGVRDRIAEAVEQGLLADG